MSVITATPTPTLVRVYPHVKEIADWPTQQSVQLLWGRIHDLEARLQAAQTTITTLVGGHNAQETTLTALGQDVRQALAASQAAVAGGGTDTGGLPGGGDGGAGSIGCAAAGPTGHDTGGLLNAIRAGQIVCGTANEWSALTIVTADLATRQANAEELLLRIIWHLREAGFTAGRQKNPSGAISKDKLCVVVDSITRAYDVFISFDDYTIPMVTTMGEVGAPNLQDETGIPD